ncbi:hypothetical protein DFH06DRAFT_1397090 [Mycena polygramma]|nr:hypothetical protein DFH06DRAFT_1397090 [Mycena polygramma]
MSRARQAAQQSQHPDSAPYALKRRRTIMACVNCRKRKIRCITTEQPPTNPCARCTKKRIPCEYVAVPEPEWYSASSPSPQTPEFPASAGDTSASPSPWTPPPLSPPPSQAPSLVPHLPYTAPPAGHRPRYAGGRYPDLALGHQSSQPDRSMSMPTSPYYPNSGGQLGANQSPYPYYSQNPYPQQQHSYPQHTYPSASGSTENRHNNPLPPMPFFADTHMPQHELDLWQDSEFKWVVPPVTEMDIVDIRAADNFREFTVKEMIFYLDGGSHSYR